VLFGPFSFLDRGRELLRSSPVPISLASDSIITIRQATTILPQWYGGKPVHFSRVFRWITEGILAFDGERIKLDALRLGGRWITSEEALQRFVERLTPKAPKQRRPRKPAAAGGNRCA
jgi:hypothetical protein